MKKLLAIFASIVCATAVLTSCKQPSSGGGGGGEKRVKTLVLMYMDADGNLNDSMFGNIKEAERGLAATRTLDSRAKGDYDDVTIAVLWDGCSKAEATENKRECFFPNTQLYELGPEYEPKPEEGVKEKKISKNTKNVSDTSGGWIPRVPDGQEQTEQVVELDVSKVDNFVKFLAWAKSRYTADRIILEISNHGGGARAACWDDTKEDGTHGGETFITTKELATAISGSGLHPAIFIEDCCLLGAVEEAYELKGCADFLIASPQLVPGGGCDYNALVQSLRKSNSSSTIAKGIVDAYKESYKKYVKKEYFEEIATKHSTGDYLRRTRKQTLYMANDFATMTAIDLKNMEDIKTTVNAFALKAMTLTGKYDGLKRTVETVNENDPIACTGSYFKYATEGTSLIQKAEALRAYGLNQVFLGSTEDHTFDDFDPNFMYFTTYTHSYDLGRFMDIVKEKFSGETELCKKADDVINALDKAIIASWRASLEGEKARANGAKFANMYYKGHNDVNFSGGHYGLSIMTAINGLETGDDDKEYPKKYVVEVYPKDKKTGTKWSEPHLRY